MRRSTTPQLWMVTALLASLPAGVPAFASDDSPFVSVDTTVGQQQQQGGQQQGGDLILGGDQQQGGGQQQGGDQQQGGGVFSGGQQFTGGPNQGGYYPVCDSGNLLPFCDCITCFQNTCLCFKCCFTNKWCQPILCHFEVPCANYSKWCWLPAKTCGTVCFPLQCNLLGTSKPGAFVTFKDPNSGLWCELCDTVTICCVSQIPFSGGGSKCDPFLNLPSQRLANSGLFSKSGSTGQQGGGQQQGGQQQGGQQQGGFFSSGGGQQQQSGSQQQSGGQQQNGGQQGTFTRFGKF